MDKLVGGLVTTIIIVALIFWIFNNPNGIGDGLDKGGSNLKSKIVSATG